MVFFLATSYGVGILMTWFENYFIVRMSIERPIFYSSRIGQLVFDFLRLAICYGMIAMAWYLLNWQIAVGFLAVYLIFNRLTFNKYYRARIQQLTSMYVAEGMELQDAASFATEVVNNTIKGGGRPHLM